MTKSRSFVTFNADFADDAVFAASGDIITPRGRNVCEDFVRTLRSKDVSVSNPMQYEFYGWEFTANISGAEMWFLLQSAENWLLIIEDRSKKKTWFGKIHDISSETLQVIDEVIAESHLLSNAQWFTKKEFESGTDRGSPDPY